MGIGVAIGTALAAGAASTGASLVQSNKAQHTAKREYNEQQNQLIEQKNQALNKRKQQIDDLRYNLLGSNSSSNKIKNNETNSLINNDITLG